jgi:predicted transcriptional regulator
MDLDDNNKSGELEILNSCLYVNSTYWSLEIGAVLEDKDGGINSFDYVIRDRYSDRFFVVMQLKTQDKERLEEISLLSIQSKNVGASKCYALSKKEFTKKEKSLTDLLLIDRIKTIMYDGKEMIVLEDTNIKSAYENLKSKKKDNTKNRRRDKGKILIDILSLTRQEEGAGITRIIYRCNLNYKAALSFIEEMKTKNLIEIFENEFKQKRYKITREGLKTLEELVRINKYLDVN